MEQLSRSEMVKQMKKQNKTKNKYIKPTKSYANSISKPIVSKDMSLETDSTDFTANKSFQLRIVLASFLFLLFLGMKEKGLQFQNFTYNTVIDVISDNSGMESAKEFTEEFVITTFNSLD